MPIRRVAIIFDNRSRPETTGVYCHRALGQLVEVEHFLPTDLATIPREGFDLYLNIDDGLQYHLPTDLRPAAWWAIDTHLNAAWCLGKARTFDTVFAAQRDGAEMLRSQGCGSATWLPLACDPDFHRPHAADKRFDVSFVGNIFPGARAELLELVRRKYPATFIGQRYFEEMAQTYSESRIVFNRSLRNDINMRVFEAVACGSLLLTNDLSENGQSDLLVDGVHLATYRDAEDLLAKITYYLCHAAKRDEIAKAGQAEVLAKHTYLHRMKQILKDSEQRLPPAREVSLRSARPTAVPSSNPAAKDAVYFDHLRPEVLALIPESAERVLDIGCGSGRLGAAVKERQKARVSGIELDVRAAARARRRIDDVWECDVEDSEFSLERASFDCIICADVLEHLREPMSALGRIRHWLAPSGRLVASIPNVRHHSVIRGLLAGNWTYEPAGLLDATHLRFFTRREIEKLFHRSGFAIESLQVVPGPGHSDWNSAGRPGEVRIGHLHIQGLKPQEAEEFFVYQYLITALPEPERDYGLTSIVILTHNQIEFTRLCVESIRQYTDEPIELIFVDNASTDGTVDYLESMADIALIKNSENRGFPAGANQGIRAANGRQILLLNNDVVATTGWLDRLLCALHSASDVGIVGPCSNCVSGAQEIPVDYDSLSDLDGFSWDWCKSHDREYVESDRLIGFCFLLKRELIERVGLLDERFGTGCFEDDDYCRRATQAGYRLLNARDAFVHHFGGRTFVGAGVDYAALMQANQELFREKWSQEDPPAARPQTATTVATPSPPILRPSNFPSVYELHEAEGGGLLLRRKQIAISLCLICRDNERTIEDCLASIRPWVDEMVVVDTGSRDATPAIARRLGAVVYEFPWCDDFSAARNESFRYARGEWIFWMDSDDTISPECGRMLRETVAQHDRPEVLGYVVQVHCPGNSPGDVTAVDHVKLVRNRPDLRFEGRIHEQIIPSIRESGGEVGWTDAYVVHSGSDRSEAGHERKIERDLRILKKDLAERPNHTFVLFNLGMTYSDASRHEEAVGFLRRSIEAATPGESHLRKAYAILISSLARLERAGEASEVCELSCRLYPDDPELLFHKGVLSHQAGRLVEAEQAFLAAMQRRSDRHFSSIDQGITGYKVRHNLAIVYVDMQAWEKAEHEWVLVIEEMPDYRDAWIGLGKILVEQGKFAALRELGLRASLQTATRPLEPLWRAHMLKAEGDPQGAHDVLLASVRQFEGDAELRTALCQYYFEQGQAHQAEAHLRKLLELDPRDAAAHHNLGTIMLREGRGADAVSSYQSSLSLRPSSSATWLQLGYSHRMLDRMSEAVKAFREAVRLDPRNTEAVEVLQQLGRYVTS